MYTMKTLVKIATTTYREDPALEFELPYIS
jgi:hypothetical protein